MQCNARPEQASQQQPTTTNNSDSEQEERNAKKEGPNKQEWKGGEGLRK
jgi:hypothetical protein